MESYWPKRLTFDDDNDANVSDDDAFDSEEEEQPVVMQPPPGELEDEDDEDPAVAYARHRKNLANRKAAGFAGWQAELRAYTKDIPSSAKPGMDLCKYWEVS